MDFVPLVKVNYYKQIIIIMLYPKVINCPTCGDIPALLQDIDCKLNELAIDLYNNTVFILNRPITYLDTLALLNYKRILTAKYCNPDYACAFTVEMIASKVKRLTLGCFSKCKYDVRPSTTSTTTSSSTTTTTTTVTPTTTTTTTI